ncbi:unnamed protein product [Polarella glacialis]|uniref:Uncharacterized protein n=1 Tax=Polarella glacialis TaxID=89957 RepID=A0A813EGU9_POLGL|nr:unnamed protein product [Polarella glacialis]
MAMSGGLAGRSWLLRRAPALFWLFFDPCGAETLAMRDVNLFLDPVFVPDFFFDLATRASDVMEALSSVPPYGEPYRASVLDGMVPGPPSMAPVLLWQTGLWQRQAALMANATALLIDIGAHEWSKFLPRLRTEPRAFLVLIEPGRAAFLELYRRLKSDYPELLDRIIALPVAMSLEPGLFWGFRTLHTNDFLKGECNSLMPPESGYGHPCTEEGARQIVPAMSLDVLLQLLILGRVAAQGEALELPRNIPKVELKIDAQGADLGILEVMRHSTSPSFTRALLEQLDDVQLEVSAPIYKGMASRHEVLERMSLLGFQLRWSKAWVEDGGKHEVVRGCRLVTAEPLTEDCFFRRAPSWVHGPVLDLAFYHPFQLLRGNEGAERSLSQQYSEFVSRHSKECLDLDLPEEVRQMAYGCMMALVQLPLADLFAGVLYLWQLVWETGLNAAWTQRKQSLEDMFSSLWQVLSIESWAETHDSGAAQLLFAVAVEGTCTAYPSLCGPGVPRLGAGRPVPCESLSACFQLFKAAASSPQDLAADPGRFEPIFRAAQRLAAPSCAPSEWNLELDSASLPSIVTDDGQYNMTAIAVDSSNCAIEISLIVWYGSAEFLLDSAAQIWHHSSKGRDLEATDIRIPTEGWDWKFDCVFGSSGQNPQRELRTRGELSSYALLSEIPSSKGSPVITVHCAVPPDWADQLRQQAHAAPTFVRLERSLRAHIDMPFVALQLPLRQFARPRVRTALCSQQAWDFPGLESRAPGHVELWFRFHIDVLGIDEVYLYDLDGSFENLDFVQELRARGRLIYDESIRDVPPLGDIYRPTGMSVHTAHFAQSLVQQHCWQSARHNADWVISVPHGWDMFLFSPVGHSIDELLSALAPNQMHLVHGVRYGATPDGAEDHDQNVFGRFPLHIDPEIRPERFGSPEEHIIIAPPRLVSSIVLSNLAPRVEASLFSNLLEPLQTLGSGFSDALPEYAGRMMHETQHLDPQVWRANHYVQLLGRSLLYKEEELHPELRDFRFYDESAVELGMRLAENGLAF